MDSLEKAVRTVFLNDERELRSGWRVCVFVACLVALTLILRGMVAMAAVFLPGLRTITEAPPDVQSPAHTILEFFLDSGVNLLAAIIATYICARKLEHRSFGSVGFKPHSGWLYLFAIGTLLGAGTLGLAIAAETVVGSATFRPQGNSTVQLLSTLVPLFAVFLIPAAVEELIFRGFAFQALVHNAGPVVAIGIMSVSFGLAHLGNPNPTLISTANTVLAGIWLSVAYLVTRSLWFSTALHYSWNLAMVYLFGLPVSGISTFDRFGVLAGQDRPPVWVSGGDYGPEGGIAVTVVLILSTFLVWKSGLFRTSDEMASAIKHGTEEPEYISILNSETGDHSS